MNYPTSPTTENSSISKLALEYYKRFGRNRDLQQYFVLSTPLALSEERIDVDNTTLKPEVKFTFNVNENRTKSIERDLDKLPEIVVENVETGRLSSASSVLSDKRLEWDSGADVGYSNFYSNRTKERSFSLPSLSTIESVDYTKQFIGSDSRISDKMQKNPNAESTPKNQVQQFFKDDAEITPILKNTENIEKRLVEQTDNLRVSFENLKERIVSIRKKSVSLEDTRTIDQVPVPTTSVSQPNLSESCLRSPFIENLFIYSPTVLKFLTDTQSDKVSDSKMAHFFDKEIQTTLDHTTSNENQNSKMDKSEIYYSVDNSKNLNTSNEKTKKHETLVPKSNSFEYIPENTSAEPNPRVTSKNDHEQTGKSNKILLTSTETETTNTDSERSIADILMQTQYSRNLTEDLEKSVSALKNVIETKNYTAKDKKRLIKRIVKKIVTTNYDDDSPENIYDDDLNKNVPWTPVPLTSTTLEHPDVSSASSYDINSENLITLIPQQSIDDFDKDTFMLHVRENPIQIDEPQNVIYHVSDDSKSITEDDDQEKLNWKNNITLSEKIFHQRLKYLHNQREALTKKIKRRKDRSIYTQNFKQGLEEHAFQKGDVASAIDPTINKEFIDFTEKEREEHLKWVETEIYHLSQLRIFLEAKNLPPTTSSQKYTLTTSGNSNDYYRPRKSNTIKHKHTHYVNPNKVSSLNPCSEPFRPQRKMKHTHTVPCNINLGQKIPSKVNHSHIFPSNVNFEQKSDRQMSEYSKKPTKIPETIDREVQVSDDNKDNIPEQVDEISKQSLEGPVTQPNDFSSEIQDGSLDETKEKSISNVSENEKCKDHVTQTIENMPEKLSKFTSYSIESASENSEAESEKSESKKIMCPHILEKIEEFQRYLEEIRNNKIAVCCCKNTSKECQKTKESDTNSPKDNINVETSSNVETKNKLKKPNTKQCTCPIENSLKSLKDLKNKIEPNSDRKSLPRQTPDASVTVNEGSKTCNRETQISNDKQNDNLEKNISEASNRSDVKQTEHDNFSEIQNGQSSDQKKEKSVSETPNNIANAKYKDDATQTLENIPEKLSRSTSYSIRNVSSSNSEQESQKSLKPKQFMCSHSLEKKLDEFRHYLEEIRNNKIIVYSCDNTFKQFQKPKDSTLSVAQSTNSSQSKIENTDSQVLKMDAESNTSRKISPEHFPATPKTKELQEHFDYAILLNGKTSEQKSVVNTHRSNSKDSAVQCPEPHSSNSNFMTFEVRNVHEPEPNIEKILLPTSISSRSSTNCEFPISSDRNFRHVENKKNSTRIVQVDPETLHLRAGQSDSSQEPKICSSTCQCCHHRKNNDINNLRKKVQEMLNRCEKCHSELEKSEKPSEFSNKMPSCQCRCKSPNVEFKFIDPRNLTEKAKKDIKNSCCCRDYKPLCRNCQQQNKISRQNLAYFLRLESRDDLVIEQSSSSERSPSVEVQIHVPKFKKVGERIVPNDEIKFIQYTNLENKKLPALKDFLLMNNPNFVQAADSRRQYLLDVESERKIKMHLIKNDLNNVSTDFERKLIDLLRSKKYRIFNNRKRLFSTRTMKEMTRSHYRKCVETKQRKAENQNKKQARTNRLMKDLFSKTLEQYAHEGKLDFSFSKTVL